MTLLDFLTWYFINAPKAIFIIWRNFFYFFFDVCGVRYHTKTLLRPWHGVRLTYDFPSRIQNFFFSLASQIIGRAIGALIRSFFIVMGIGLAFIWLLFLPLFEVLRFWGLLIIFLLFRKERALIPLGTFLFLLFIGYFFKKNFSHNDRERNAFIKNHLGFDYTNPTLLEEHDITKEDLEKIQEWFLLHQKIQRSRHAFWTKEFLDRIPPIGMDWASGYTPFLDTFSHEQMKEQMPLDTEVILIGYREYIERAEQMLAAAQGHNVLIVGEESAGTDFILKGLESLIESGKSLPALAYKRFIWLDAQTLLSGISHSGVLRERLSTIFLEAQQAGNIIIGIERLHAFLDPAFPEMSEILIPFLQLEGVQVVATTTPRFFSRVFASREGLMSLFNRIQVNESSPDDIFFILSEVALNLEKRFDVHIRYQSVKKIIEEVDALSAGTHPQKDILSLDGAVSSILAQGKKILEPQDILTFFSTTTGIPLGAIQEGEREKLLALEDILHERVIDQKEAIDAVAKALRRARMNVRNASHPIGNFLFLGPTGVGKTSVAKALSGAMFGGLDAMIRFDMSEFQSPEDIKRLIGFSYNGEFQGGLLTEQIKNHPFALLLLDEIEKAHPDILNLFLPMLDEAILIDGDGYKVNFKNVIIIATSNAGSEFIRSHIKEVGDTIFSQKLLDVIQKENIFRPEFLNRFDAIVAFKPLGKDELIAIAELMLKELAAQLQKEHRITLIINEDEKKFLAEKGFTQEYGARPMARVLQDTIESYIAQKILEGQIKKGDTIEFTATDLAKL